MSSTGSSLAAVRALVLADFSPEERRRLDDAAADFVNVPVDAKVSCKFGDACTSPSRRDPTKCKAWLCGSDSSHNVRLRGCIAYYRFERVLKNKQSYKQGFAKL